MNDVIDRVRNLGNSVTESDAKIVTHVILSMPMDEREPLTRVTPVWAVLWRRLQLLGYDMPATRFNDALSLLRSLHVI